MFSYTALALTEEQVSINEGEEFQRVSVIMNYLIPFKGKQSKYVTKQIAIIIIISVEFLYGAAKLCSQACSTGKMHTYNQNMC